MWLDRLMTTSAPDNANTPTPNAATAKTILSEPADPQDCYPKNESHQWQEFAYLAIEAGGYRDLTAINPWNGQRLWAADMIDADDDNIYNGLRRLIDTMEREQFLTKDEPES